ncbi:tRNA lysidine(34) synthetase TilS [Malaciobacter molluscorum LMG 25693]|uniref:tRNA(Ile)-lysidine synthase n=1 Tax=Malaciobacter molluscorum LMG 25693 TaxID=870501 RepID=A0A2G1DH37_9BACT|nr:tRNA lysidine(34) synthetase TilS [Malaciobacter molluscorum]AXX93425.1 tRNA(Ile)-lysidine synthetase [Malaciobacter molluscorum LMG 25693]PHO17828.1 tRNA lysidine(34) synthetase TilS [Malaciobacter molluscorum LMG 25693]
MQLNLEELTSSKNLLAFSAGVDSTALFFLLKENNISFDIAIVNYNLREQSKQEVEYAKYLANKFNKKIYLKEVNLSGSNFEKRARDIRYNFFEEIINKNNYNTLITAHQLNDKLEWFLMQLSKGAGLSELLGLQKIQNKSTYKIFRPILDISKEELEGFLVENKIDYFVDKSNFEEKYKRNYFRHNFSNQFLSEFKDGIKNSFEYLQEDLNSLNINFIEIFKEKELSIFEKVDDNNINIKVIDKHLKKIGILISKAQREEIIKQKESVISNKITVCLIDKYIWICPYIKEPMKKEFKEYCRKNKIPKLCRSYIYKENIKIDIF